MLDFINQNGPIKFFVAFAIVLGLIGLTAWLVRRFSANRLGGSTRGRQPRLAVIDAASVDGRRRLVLIRRDNVEHLMMIGGPNDLVVEPNIVRATATRDTGREGYRSTPPEARPPVPASDGNGGAWPLQPAVEPPLAAPVQTPASRSYRAPVTDEPWVAPEPPAREPNLRARPQDNITGNISGSITSMATEFNAKLSPDLDVPPPPPRQVTPVVPVTPPVAAAPPPPAPPAPAPQTDRNLAEMAQRLEAALRRPNTRDDVHPPVTDPLAASMPPKMPEPQQRAEPKLEFTPEPKAEPKFEPKIEPKLEAKAEPKAEAKSKNPFDSLEEEMASLLGRQPGKT
jgi:hypothetical protein